MLAGIQLGVPQQNELEKMLCASRADSDVLLQATRLFE